MEKKFIKVEFSLGLEYRAGGIRLNPEWVKEVLEIDVVSRAAQIFGGVYVTRTFGGWRGANETYKETGATVTTNIVDCGAETVVSIKVFAEYLKGLFEQEAVAVTITPVSFYLV